MPKGNLVRYTFIGYLLHMSKNKSEVSRKIGTDLDIELDAESVFIAGYLSWARKSRVYGTQMPMISYRGHSNSDWKLLPTLCRQKLPSLFLKGYEDEIISAFRNKFSLTEWSDIEVLSFAQHHGAPTRLLDWSNNPLVGLWFAVSDKSLDKKDGAVFQLCLGLGDKEICPARGFQLDHTETCAAKHTVHVFSCSQKIPRSEKQRSVFSIASFTDDKASTPLDSLISNDKTLRQFPVPAAFKSCTRRLLTSLGLDAFSIYGDPDSFGKSLSSHFDFSDLNILPSS